MSWSPRLGIGIRSAGVLATLVVSVVVTALVAGSALGLVGTGGRDDTAEPSPQLLAFSSCNTVSVTVLQPEAAGINRFFRRSGGNDQYLYSGGSILTNFDVGTTVSLGQVQGSLILGIEVVDTGERFVSGPVSSGTVGFEDWNDGDYDDAILFISSTPSSPAPSSSTR